jgi:hypothetical protein
MFSAFNFFNEGDEHTFYFLKYGLPGNLGWQLLKMTGNKSLN